MTDRFDPRGRGRGRGRSAPGRVRYQDYEQCDSDCNATDAARAKGRWSILEDHNHLAYTYEP